MSSPGDGARRVPWPGSARSDHAPRAGTRPGRAAGARCGTASRRRSRCRTGPPGRRVRGQRPEREQVGRPGQRRPAACSGAMNPGVPIAMPVGSAGGVGRAGDPEVDHPRPVRGQQHVGRLQVAVHHPGRVNRRNASAIAAVSSSTVCAGSGPKAGDRRRNEGLARRRWPARAACIRAGVEDLRGVQAVDPLGRRISWRSGRGNPASSANSGRTTLSASARPPGGEGEVDPAHPAGAEPCSQPVAGDLAGSSPASDSMLLAPASSESDPGPAGFPRSILACGASPLAADSLKFRQMTPSCGSPPRPGEAW